LAPYACQTFLQCLNLRIWERDRKKSSISCGRAFIESLHLPDTEGFRRDLKVLIIGNPFHVFFQRKFTSGGDAREIFQPGYTTKARGWGLGLSLCKRIIEEYHGGRIEVGEGEGGLFVVSIN
jgi:hypothetical protein